MHRTIKFVNCGQFTLVFYYAAGTIVGIPITTRTILLRFGGHRVNKETNH
jgi:hypothetical protein